MRLQGKAYQHILDEEYRWPNWTMPKTANGKLDIRKAMTGPDPISSKKPTARKPSNTRSARSSAS